MNPVTSEDKRNYKIFKEEDYYKPEPPNQAAIVPSLPNGTKLRDCFGTSFVIVKNRDEQPRRNARGLSACANDDSSCGPKFV